MKKILAVLTALSLMLALCACHIIDSDRDETNETELPSESAADTQATTAPTTVPQEPVETVIDYSREILSPDNNTYLTHHQIRCPALTADTQDAQAINQELYDLCAGAVETLESGEPEEYIYLLDYEVTNYNGILGLVMDLTTSALYGGVFSNYRVYFFDTNTGEQLTYEEYAQALGLSQDRLVQALANDVYPPSEPYTISWAAADETQTYILVESVMMMDGFALYELDCSVLD